MIKYCDVLFKKCNYLGTLPRFNNNDFDIDGLVVWLNYKEFMLSNCDLIDEGSLIDNDECC